MSERPFRLALISAWNDSGGGITHRLFDGHSHCWVYPFELLLGGSRLQDGFRDWFHSHYRWPLWPGEGIEAGALFDAMPDPELKNNLHHPQDNKFQDFPVAVAPEQWRARFVERMARTPSKEMGVGAWVAAYMESLFQLWRDRPATGRERLYLGHCPNIVLDAERIFQDLPETRILHVVRSPLSGFVDLHGRRPAITAVTYAKKWNLINLTAYQWARRYPDRVRLLFYADLILDRVQAMREAAKWLGLPFEPILTQLTWNSVPLPERHPFGGVSRFSQAWEQEAPTHLQEADRETLRIQTAGTCTLLGLDPAN